MIIGQIMLDMLRINQNDTKRINHALKVFSYAKCMAENEGVDEYTQTIIETTALLHDIGIQACQKKYGQVGGHLQQKEGPAIAKKILSRYTNDRELIERVCYLIAHHHTYKHINGMDYQIIIEADFLVNYEEQNIQPRAFELAYNKFFVTNIGKQIAQKIGFSNT